MKKIICLCFCAGIMNLIGDVGVLSRSDFKISERLLQPKRKSSYNHVEFSGKRHKNHSEKLKANSGTTDLYHEYYNNPDKFLIDLKNTTDTNYLKSMLYTLGKYNFFYSSWNKEKINQVENNSKIKNRGLKCDDDFWAYVEM